MCTLQSRGFLKQFTFLLAELHFEIFCYLSAIDEFHSGLAKEEVDVVLVLQGVHEVRC